MERIIFNTPSELTAETEHELYRHRGEVMAVFRLSGDNNLSVLEAMHRLRKIFVPVAVSIDMSDPVQAMKSFFDVAGLTPYITLDEIPEESVARFGRECYDRMLDRVRSHASRNGIQLETDNQKTL